DDGVYWVPPAAIDSPQLFVSSIAQAIGFHFEASEDPQAQLLDYLRDKEMLLLLDSFEHVLAGAQATDLLVSILKSAPRISMLVTSRERLGLQAEYLVDLSGLSYPDQVQSPKSKVQSQGERTLDFMSYDAVQLFM